MNILQKKAALQNLRKFAACARCIKRANLMKKLAANSPIQDPGELLKAKPPKPDYAPKKAKSRAKSVCGK